MPSRHLSRPSATLLLLAQTPSKNGNVSAWSPKRAKNNAIPRLQRLSNPWSFRGLFP
jgi:hypothetical protein